MAGAMRQDPVVSYKRIAIQCTDAEIQLKNGRMSLKSAREVCHLTRLLLHSIDLYYEGELSRPTTVHSRQRGEAKNALSQLRSAVRGIR